MLWNARLEEDKDPESFLQLLHQLCDYYMNDNTPPPCCYFRLIVLGKDPGKDEAYYNCLHHEFSKEMMILGFCPDREEYCKWIHRADIVVSMAEHKTFGIATVESIWYGNGKSTMIVPSLPKRLSYPELFLDNQFRSSSSVINVVF